MTDNRKNLKISEETYELLSEDKPDGVTWGYYLQNLIGESTRSVQYVRDIAVFNDAEDVKRVQFTGVGGDQVEVGITDDLAAEFVTTAAHVAQSIDEDVDVIESALAGGEDNGE